MNLKIIEITSGKRRRVEIFFANPIVLTTLPYSMQSFLILILKTTKNELKNCISKLNFSKAVLYAGCFCKVFINFRAQNIINIMTVHRTHIRGLVNFANDVKYAFPFVSFMCEKFYNFPFN